MVDEGSEARHLVNALSFLQCSDTVGWVTGRIFVR